MLVVPACGERRATDGPAGEAAVDSASLAPRLVVVATSWPTAWLADQLAGESIELEVLADPAGAGSGFSPSGDDVLRLQEADLVLAHGLGLEPWLATASVPRQRLVWTTEGISALTVPGPVHSHGEEGAHSHDQEDPYLWLDPETFKSQLENVAMNLAARLPQGQSEIEAERQRLVAELSKLSAELAEATDRSFILTSPHARYLARSAGRSNPSFDWQALDPAELAHDLEHEVDHALRSLDEEAAGRPIVLWLGTAAPQPGDGLARAMAALREHRGGLSQVVLDGLAGLPTGESSPGGWDYFGRMRSNIVRLQSIDSPEKGQAVPESSR